MRSKLSDSEWMCRYMPEHLLELSDEELIEKYNQGETHACDVLLERYKNLVRKKAKAMFIAGGDEDDLIQEGMIGLYKSIRDYRYDKSTTFMTFASMCINNQICTAVSTANRKKHNPLNTYLSFYMPIEGDDDGECDGETKLIDILHMENELSPEDQLVDRETTREIVDRLCTILSNMEKQVLGYFLDGDGYVEIAARLGKSPKSIDNALQRIKAKMIHLLQ